MGVLAVIIGVAGSGKSSLMNEAFLQLFRKIRCLHALPYNWGGR